MGGKSSGGGARTPKVAPVTLESAQRLKIVDVLCEGVKDTAHPITPQDVFLNDTPLQNTDGSWNFEGVEIYALPGTPDQDYLPGFDTSDTVVSVGARVKQAQPVVRRITDPNIDRIRVTVAVGGLEQITGKGDTEGATVTLAVSAGSSSRTVTITGRANAAYHRDVVLDNLPPVPFNLSVARITPDSTDNKLRDETTWVSYVESIDAKLNYPDCVVVGLKIDSALFGGQVPRRTYRSRWQVVEVPDNYDPDTRSYSGVWNGVFKRAWTDNPAWLYRDLVLNERYGLAKYREDIQVDKWALYAIARYCDELVDDGVGGKEPRFTCNAYLTEPRDAYDVLADMASCFRGITYFDGMQQVAVADTPKDPVAIYSNNNVVDGVFEYTGVAYKDITTACIVKFADKDNSFMSDSVQYQDDAAIARYGYNVKTLTGFGCTSRGQAQRVARWYVETALRERESVSFKIGREGIRHLPYDVIRIADNDWAGAQIGARILSQQGDWLTLDREAEGSRIMLLTANGEQSAAIAERDGVRVRIDKTLTVLPGTPCALSSDTLAPRLFRAVSITENDDGTYTVSAIAHDAAKAAVVDGNAAAQPAVPTTRHGKPQVYAGRIAREGNSLVLQWEAMAAGTVSYEVKIYRGDALYGTHQTGDTRLNLGSLPSGQWRAEIRARDSFGALSEALIVAWAIDYTITALRAKGKVFAIELNWEVPAHLTRDAWTELHFADSDDIGKAQLLARLPYPAAQYTMNNIGIEERYYFWARIVDSDGNRGAWTQSVLGEPSQDPTAILSVLEGKITNTQLHKDLADSIDKALDGMDPLMAGDAVEYAGDDTRYAGAWSMLSTIQEGDYSQAQRIDVLKAQMNDTAASVTQTSKAVADLNGKASALYSVSVSATTPEGQPIIGGIAVGVDGQTASSEVLLQADKLMLWDSQKRPMFTFVDGKAGINGDLIVDGSILGQHIRANQTLRSPFIEGGNLNIGNGNFTVNNQGEVGIKSGSINLGNGIFTVDRNGNVTIKRGQINIGNGNFVVDANGNITAKSGSFEGNIYAKNLQGNILKAYEIHRESIGRYRRRIPAVEKRSLVRVQFLIAEEFYFASARCYFNGNLQTDYAAARVVHSGELGTAAPSGNHVITFETITDIGSEVEVYLEIHKSADLNRRVIMHRERDLIDAFNGITAMVIPLG